MLVDLGKTYADRKRRTLQEIFRKICCEFNLPMRASEGFAIVASLTDRNLSIEYQKVNGGSYIPCGQRPLLDALVYLTYDNGGQPTGEFSCALRSEPIRFGLDNLIQAEVK